MIFGLFQKKRRVGGEIALHGLSDWWLAAFDEGERDVVRALYQPLGGDGRQIDEGSITASTSSPLSFLSTLAGWFATEENRTIAYRILMKAEEFETDDLPVLSFHFAMQARCETFYRWRDYDELALEQAIRACERGISVSREAAAEFERTWGVIPSHHCFKQLAIIEEKRGNTARALDLCQRATAEGWGGDWVKRIDRLKKRASR